MDKTKLKKLFYEVTHAAFILHLAPVKPRSKRVSKKDKYRL